MLVIHFVWKHNSKKNKFEWFISNCTLDYGKEYNDTRIQKKWKSNGKEILFILFIVNDSMITAKEDRMQ